MLLSVCSIMKNEVKAVVAFIECYKQIADEIVIIDNGSEDDTAAKARELGCKVYSSSNEFDLARNDFFQYASGEWILSVDADELMDENSMKLLRSTISRASQDGITSFILPNHQYYGEGKWATWYLARVFRNQETIRFDSAMHGSITKNVKSSFGYCTAIIHHLDGITNQERRLFKRQRNIPLIQKQIEEEPLRPSNYNYLAQEQLAVGDIMGALTSIKKGYSFDYDKHTYATIFYAQIAYKAGMYEVAWERACEQLQITKEKIKDKDKLSPRYVGLSDLANIVLGNIMIKNGEKDKVINLICESIQRMPEAAHNYLNLYSLVGEKKLIGKAIECNPFLKKEIYTPNVGPTIYEAQSSFLESVNNIEKDIREWRKIYG